MKKFITIIVSIILMIIVLTSCYSYTAEHKSPGSVGQAGKQEGEDIFVRNDNWIYTNPSFYRAFPDGIYKTNNLGNALSFTVICNDKAGCINVIGSQIYYINASDGNKIYCINTDGTNKRKLLDTPADSLYIIDNAMFFQDESIDDKGNKKSWLYSAKIDGSKLKCLNSQYTMDACISDGWIYFMDGYKDVSKMRVDGTDKHIITKKKVWSIAVCGDWIYYNDKNTGDTSNLYKMKKDGSKITKINDDNLMFKIDNKPSFNWKVFQDWIYYTNASDGDKLYRISVSGKDKKKLGNEICTGVYLTDEAKFVDFMMMYKLNNNKETFKDFYINKTTGEVIDYGQYILNK